MAEAEPQFSVNRCKMLLGLTHNSQLSEPVCATCRLYGFLGFHQTTERSLRPCWRLSPQLFKRTCSITCTVLTRPIAPHHFRTVCRDRHSRIESEFMRQVLHMLSATVFLLLGSAAKPINLSEKLPSFRDFHRRIWAGEVDLADNDPKIVYGMVHWEQLLQNIRQARFEEALRIVSNRHACQEDIPRLLPLAE